jgi:acyl-CoA carboxylase epsilon subunit-like protein
MGIAGGGDGESALRVERGHASEEELAAITIVLLALRTAATAAARRVRPGPGRARWRNGPDGYRSPRSWR